MRSSLSVALTLVIALPTFAGEVTQNRPEMSVLVMLATNILPGGKRSPGARWPWDLRGAASVRRMVLNILKS